MTVAFSSPIPCENPDALSARLEKECIFLVPLAKGLRVSVASVSEEKCRLIPAKIVEAMKVEAEEAAAAAPQQNAANAANVTNVTSATSAAKA